MLTPGGRVAPYDILAKLGAGGMGEVYKARDTTLNRDVAIKVLPDVMAIDPERVARFRREAQSLAALNHPNVAQVYGVIDLPAKAGSHSGLVMEFVDGDDLSAIIARGPIAVPDAIAIARQIADALDAAHDRGIIHRDLKPANIKVTEDGSVKVLDFGLAKALDSGSDLDANLAMSPTFTAPRGMTQLGVIIGTAAYMAPEQARGKAVDRRADIWAFGVVLYEMLTGRQLFDGDNISDVLASVLKTDPAWTALPPETPAPVRRLLRRCLEKDPRTRLSSIGDARLELDERETDALPRAVPVASRPGIPAWVALIAGAALTAVAGVAFWWTRPAPEGGALARLTVLGPPDLPLYPDSSMVAISPDGRSIAFIVGNPTTPDTQLWVRSLDSTTAIRFDDAVGARQPFWSPDGKRIGFFSATKLRSIAVTGGRSEVICDSPAARGGTWSSTNTIVFAAAATTPLLQVPATGGTPTPVTTLDTARKQFSHRFPSMLPDGRHFTYAAVPGRDGRFDIYVGSLDGGAGKLIGQMETAPTFASPNWLLFTRQGVLHAQRFDPAALTLSGDPIPLGDEPARLLDSATSFTAGRSVSAAASGSLAYFSVPSNQTQAVWFDVTGRNLGALNLPAGHYDAAKISPDGAYAALVRSTTASESLLWLVDLSSGGAAPLTTAHGRSDGPVWSPDSKRIVFNTDREGPDTIYIKTIGDAAPEQLFARLGALFGGPDSWSPDGKWILTTELHNESAQDVYLLAADDPKRSTPLVNGPVTEMGASVSPDGKWLLYVSHETGRRELYIQSFPTPGRRAQITQAGARLGWWTPDGKGIVFLSSDGATLFQLDLASGAPPRAGIPRRLGAFPSNALTIEPTRDRKKFLAIVPTASGDGSITIVQNWLKALK